jgi:branched-chain amino acid aminotransferase
MSVNRYLKPSILPIPLTMTQTNGTTSTGSHQAPLAASNLYFTPLPAGHQVAPGKEKHGRYMLAIPWNRVSGWGQPTIGPRQELTVDPLSGVMQYAVTCFEGMKVKPFGVANRSKLRSAVLQDRKWRSPNVQAQEELRPIQAVSSSTWSTRESSAHSSTPQLG